MAKTTTNRVQRQAPRTCRSRQGRGPHHQTTKYLLLKESVRHPQHQLQFLHRSPNHQAPHPNGRPKTKTTRTTSSSLSHVIPDPGPSRQCLAWGPCALRKNDAGPKMTTTSCLRASPKRRKSPTWATRRSRPRQYRGGRRTETTHPGRKSRSGSALSAWQSQPRLC